MNYKDKWLGLAGGGFGFSLIGGVGVYQIDLFNMGGNPVPIRALIVGTRLGATVQVEAAHAVCLLTGVSSPHDFTTLKSSGVDWTISLGAKADTVVKAGAKAVKALLALAKEGGSWAAQEGAKKAVQGLMGDFSVKPN